MTKIVMVWFVMTGATVTEPVEWDGWRSMEECKIAAESFTEPNPKDNATGYAVIAKCVEIPK